MLKLFKVESIRNFYLENENGTRIDFQNQDGSLFLYEISGLGHEKSISYEQIGDVFVPVNEKMVQTPITGTIEFDRKADNNSETSYDAYNKFVDFVYNSKSLRLIYIPKLTNRVEYYRDIDFISIDKSEEDDFGILSCPVKFKPKSLWYKEGNAVISINPSDNEMRWDFTWDAIFIDYNTSNIVYENKGHTESSFRVEIDGFIENPVIEIYQDDVLIYSLAITITIEAYEKFIFSSKDGNPCIKKQNTDGTFVNLFTSDYVSPANVNIFKLPKGTSKLKIAADDDINSARISIYEYYKTV